MKLFQKMLVAPAALGLLAPMAATANEVTINDFNPAEELAVTNSRVDSLEAKLNNFEAGGFSDTTTLDGKAVFTVGALDAPESESNEGGGGVLTDATIFQYSYTMNLNTSFTGDDNLYVRIKTGNGSKIDDVGQAWSEKEYGTYLSSSNQNGDVLKVDKIWYTMPLGESVTFTVGPKIENYYMHATTPSIYKPVLKQFTLGGNAAAYGASTSPGAGLAWTSDSGLAVSTNFTSQSGNTKGLLTDENKTSWATQVGYTKDQYSVSAILNQKYNGWTDGYFSTATGDNRGGDGSSTNIGLRAWWRPLDTGSAVPSISVGYDTSTIDAATNDQTDMYFVGLQWQDMFQSDDRIGVAFGQPQKNESETTDPFAWEAYYSYKLNDSVTLTPAVFGGSDRNGTAGADITGGVLEATFKF